MTGLTLRLGSRGDEVTRLQDLLLARGYRIRADGYFGGLTYGAVLSFQQRQKIPADGVVSAATWRALGRTDQGQQSTTTTSHTVPGGQVEWTFMVYMAGNNSLSDAAGRDLDEMRAVSSHNGVRVMAFVKRHDAQGRAQHMEIGTGGSPDVVEQLAPPVDSGHPQRVVDFVRWATRRAPAKHYALVIWNHGSGWTPDDLDQLCTQVRGRAARRDAEHGYVRRVPRPAGPDGEPTFSELTRLAETPEVRKGIFSRSLSRVLEMPGTQARAIAGDDGTLHSMDTVELAGVVRQIHDDLGRPLDLLGMDACLMSNLEVCYQVRDHVNVVVGSEETEPNEGWPYTELLTVLSGNPGMDARELGRSVVDEYVRSYRDKGITVTQCALDATRIEEFMREFETLAGALRQQVHMNRSVVDSVQAVATRFNTDRSLVDLRTLCLGLIADTRTDPTLASVADKMIALHSPGGFVVQEDRLGAKVEDCGGLTAYFPVERTISPYYGDLLIAQDTEWDEFLRDYGEARTIGGRRPRRQ